MKKIFALLLSLCLVLGSVACIAEGAAFTPGTYEGTGKGYSETDPVTVKVTVDENAITAVEITGVGELPFGEPAFPTYVEELIGRADADIDAVAGATMTRDGVKEAVESALAAAAANAAGMLVSDDAFAVHHLSKYAIPLINIVVVFGVIPIMLRVGKKAKKR